MVYNEITEFCQIIAQISKKNLVRQRGIASRKTAIDRIDGRLVKLAFDTRRINQETDYNPRRGLQNYNRSEQFIDEARAAKISNFTKLKNIVDKLKAKYGREAEWQDSYCRVLLNTLNTALRINQNDNDFGETQASIGSFDYVEELLFARYRLDTTAINKYGEEQLQNIILGKDEALIRKIDIPKYEITRGDVLSQPYDALLDKLFNGVRASKDNKTVERSVTITIRDTFLDE
jgi:hypothetical protein